MSNTLANIAVVIIAPFFLLGLINKTKAFWAGRQGASILQPFYDFIRLMKKSEVISETATFVFRIYPSLSLAGILVAAVLTPMINHKSILSFEGDFLAFAYFLAAARFISIVGAMDTGSSFEGMGASREAFFASIIESAFFITIGSAAALAGKFSFSDILGNLTSYYYDGVSMRFDSVMFLALVISSAAFFLMLLAEGCRVPVDDPNTHLELTMIHEVMILDNSGVDLGLLLYGAALKMVLFASLIINLLTPKFGVVWHSALVFSAFLIIIAFIIGTIESLIARLRMNLVPQFLLFSMSLSLIVFMISLISIFGGMR